MEREDRLSRVAIGGHPIHPALVAFPIVLLTAVLVTDCIYWGSGRSEWAEFSFWLIVGGLLTGFVAFITGLIDFLTIARARQETAGWLHFLLTDLAIFLTTFNFFIRLDDRQTAVLFTGLGLSAAVALLILVGSYFGGRLVFAHWIGVYGVGRDSRAGEA